uniref:Uncharacterized protein n=1 Tax=Setaria digitata TaxID=48799 RepID=A0A915PFY2_9BILA
MGSLDKLGLSEHRAETVRTWDGLRQPATVDMFNHNFEWIAGRARISRRKYCPNIRVRIVIYRSAKLAGAHNKIATMFGLI